MRLDECTRARLCNMLTRCLAEGKHVSNSCPGCWQQLLHRQYVFIVLPVDFSLRFKRNEVGTAEFRYNNWDYDTLPESGTLTSCFLVATCTYVTLWVHRGTMVNNVSSMMNKPSFVLRELVHLQLQMLKASYCWNFFLISQGAVAALYKWDEEVDNIVVWNFLSILFPKNIKIS